MLPSPSSPSPSCPPLSSVRSGPWLTVLTTASSHHLPSALRCASSAMLSEERHHRGIHQASRTPTHHGRRQPALDRATHRSAIRRCCADQHAWRHRDQARGSRSLHSHLCQFRAVGGIIDGDRAKEIFVKSKLPFDKLGAIWNLADTQAREPWTSPTLSLPCISFRTP